MVVEGVMWCSFRLLPWHEIRVLLVLFVSQHLVNSCFKSNSRDGFHRICLFLLLKYMILVNIDYLYFSLILWDRRRNV